MILLVGGESPWLTPTETPGAIYFPALSAVPLAAPPLAAPLLAALGFKVVLAGPDHIRGDLREAIERHRYTLDEARPDVVAGRHAAGRRTARENIADLVDEGSFVEYGALAVAAQRSTRPLADLIERDGLAAVPAARLALRLRRPPG